MMKHQIIWVWHNDVKSLKSALGMKSIIFVAVVVAQTLDMDTQIMEFT